MWRGCSLCGSLCGSGFDSGEPLIEKLIVDGRSSECIGPMCGECLYNAGGVRVYVAFGILNGPDTAGVAWVQALHFGDDVLFRL